MQNHKTVVHFIAHTHWDREWYMTFEQFRLRLVRLIDHVLDIMDGNPHFTCFHLDGQTIVLDDYAAIRPERMEELKQYIREGRVLVGPWYQQNDLFLTSGESTVRNLIEGISTSRELGGEMRVGYLPDHFGLAGQMPQLFSQAGLQTSVFGRGYDLAKHGSPIIRWQAPDGSEVIGILMAHWYNNAQRLPDNTEELRIVFPSIQEREESVHHVPHTLMMNGVDHLEPQEDLPQVLDKLRELYGDRYQFVQGTLEAYADAVASYLESEANTQPVATHRGELREREDYAILSGTLSARVYLKQANMEGHHLLEKQLEPLSVLAGVHGLDRYDRGYMKQLWKLYMQNHPHDSICGCSQDAVHDHMMDRYASLSEVAGDLVVHKLDIIARQVDEAGFDKGDLKLLVTNMSQVDNAGVIRTQVYFHQEDEVSRFAIEDAAGRSVPYRIVDRTPVRRQVLSPINLPGVIELVRYEIEWAPAVPALGYAVFRVMSHKQGEVVEERTCWQWSASAPDLTGQPTLENAKLRVELKPDGTFDVLDKASGQWLRGQGRFEDRGDCGDLYVHTSAGEPLLWGEQVTWQAAVKNELYEAYTYTFEWDVPTGLNETLDARSTQTARCRFEVELRLGSNDNYVSLTVDLDNHAEDHRLRLLFPTARKASHVWAGAQFDTVKRAWGEGREYQRSANTQPYWKWVAPLAEANQGFAVFAKGIVEYEALGEGEMLALTLVRSVGTIHVREQVRMETDIQPKGQCLGSYRFELALRPFAGATATALYQEAERFTQGLQGTQMAVDDDRWDRGRAWVQETGITTTFRRPDPNVAKPRLARTGKLLQLDGEAVLSAVKWAEDGSGPVVRIFSVEEEPRRIGLGLPGWTAEEAQSATILEEEQGAIAHREGAGGGSFIEAQLLPKKIATFKLLGPRRNED